jgi:hypothetical protein
LAPVVILLLLQLNSFFCFQKQKKQKKKKLGKGRPGKGSLSLSVHHSGTWDEYWLKILHTANNALRLFPNNDKHTSHAGWIGI